MQENVLRSNTWVCPKNGKPLNPGLMVQEGSVVKPAVTEPRLPELKNSEISVLARYESKPGKEIWKTFPTHYPEKISRKVNVPILKRASCAKMQNPLW